MSPRLDYDYVVVGAGSAGCAVAARLAEDGTRVCLIEAGPDGRRSALIRLPIGFLWLVRGRRYNWAYWTLPQKGLDDRRLYWPRGKALGGSSAINGQVAIRGHASDYDAWAAAGCAGWSYEDVLPVFRRMENFEPGADAFHGTGGPLNVAENRNTNPLSARFLAAAAAAGHRRNPDFNGADQEGVGYYHLTQKGGRRWSNARAYLPEGGAPGLDIVTGARTTRVLLEGARAVGVECLVDGALREIRAAREVVLCGGAVATPQLLMLSGIGPAEVLRRAGIRVRHDLPGVGENLQDHLDVYVVGRTGSREGLSLHPSYWPRGIAALFGYACGGRSALSSNGGEAGGFFRSAPGEDLPDMQWHFGPISSTPHGLDLRPARDYGYSCMVYQLRPRSRGRVYVSSADPLADPAIDPRYLSDPADLDALVAGVRRTREVFAQGHFTEMGGGELSPGPDVAGDDELRAFIRARAETAYHPAGSARMGTDDGAVVDPRLRVRGIERLRVADASIMPTLVGGNTNLPATMIGEKGAEMIREDARYIN